jgi:hypothetical protein
MYIYTVNFGNYDRISNEHFYSKKVRYICFYNQEIEKKGEWEYVKINSSKDNRYLSRNFKINFSKYFPKESNVIYVDCNRVITEKLINFSFDFFEKNSFGVLKHSARKSLLDELIDWYLISVADEKHLINLFKYLKRIKYMYDQHYCPHCCLILRKNNIQNIRFSKVWWYYYKKFNIRDQLPFTICSLKLNAKPKLFINKNLIYTKRHLYSYKKKRRNIKALSNLIKQYNHITNHNINLTPETLLWRNYKLAKEV